MTTSTLLLLVALAVPNRAALSADTGQAPAKPPTTRPAPPPRPVDKAPPKPAPKPVGDPILKRRRPPN